MTVAAHPLSIATLLRHGATVHQASSIRCYDGERVMRCSYAEVERGAARLAHGLESLAVTPGDRVGVGLWNTREHMEAFLGIPAMGATVHALNPRLSTEQLTFVIGHAGDRVILIDASLLPALEGVDLGPVEHLVVTGDADPARLAALGLPATAYHALVADQPSEYAWRDGDELDAATICYTTGTTGDPKGAAYTQRHVVLHSLGECTANSLGVGCEDVVFPISPMFHVNAWGLPYTAWLAGADIVMSGRHVQPEHLARLFAEERATVAAGVPTVLNDLLRLGEERELDLSSVRLLMCGASAVPRHLVEQFDERYGVSVSQALGMTENGLLALARPPRGVAGADALEYRARTGRVVAGVEVRAVDEDGRVQPTDGESLGELEVRGWWVIREYWGGDGGDRFRDGWLRTGDVGTVDPTGWIQITDRLKDVIKSGGEWISSVALEAAVLAHPAVAETAVIAAPDDRWFERPLVCVVRRPDVTISAEEIVDFLTGQVQRWWLPERVAFLDEVPKTSVGKFDKKELRRRLSAGELDTVAVRAPGTAGSRT